MKQYYVYMLSNRKEGVLYIGVTSDLVKRVSQHRQEMVDGFSKKYNCKILVYYETVPDIKSAITREKQLKKWKRAWKIRIIEESNPKWNDLYKHII